MKSRLDDGSGLKFRPKCTAQECHPAFSLEFPKDRINVPWEQYTDNAKFDAANAQNVQWGEQVRTYALGKEATAKIKASIAANTPLCGEVQQGHKVIVIPVGGMQVLVSITLLCLGLGGESVYCIWSIFVIGKFLR